MLGHNPNESTDTTGLSRIPGLSDTAEVQPSRRRRLAHGGSRRGDMTGLPTHRAPDENLGNQLAHVPLFKGVASEALRQIVALAHLRHVAYGEFFFNEGDDALDFFVLTTGRVKLAQLTPEGHQVVLGHIGPGDPFGGVGSFGDPTYPVSAETVEPSTALVWTSGTMEHVLQEHSTVALNAIRFVADRLHDLQRRYRQLMTERVERRVARALLRLVREAGRRVETGVEIDFPVSRQDIAEMTGTTLYTASRLMSSWEERGILGGGGSTSCC